MKNAVLALKVYLQASIPMEVDRIQSQGGLKPEHLAELEQLAVQIAADSDALMRSSDAQRVAHTASALTRAIAIAVLANPGTSPQLEEWLKDFDKVLAEAHRA